VGRGGRATPTAAPLPTAATVPTAAPGKPTQPVAAEHRPAPGGVVPDLEDDTKPLILVVDDDPSVRAALQTMLGTDYDVETAGDAASAVQKIHRDLPDLILLDIGLPDRDGIALTRDLRSRSTTMDIPIVLFTGQDGERPEAAGMHAGADDLLTKPVDPDVLLARLDTVLRRGHSRRAVS
jgi:DNA-binding response OmpR family regulator